MFMFKSTILIFASMILLTVSVSAGDLYKVEVGSKADATILIQTGAEAVVRLNDGYLVLADAGSAVNLENSELNYQLLAKDISRDQMAVDMRRDMANYGRYPLLYEAGQFRLYRADFAELSQTKAQLDLAPVSEMEIEIEYSEPTPVNWAAIANAIDLDSLIGLVEQDSLEAYVYRLQAYYRRVTGTDSNYASADWVTSKFQDFGYDSVISQEFTETIYGVPATVENVIAYKVGTVYPNRHIIVGAHRDGVPGSPAADDNGSGTAGVLEIARILKDIETPVTFVFITFDGEEQGLFGSSDYAAEAVANGDSIIYMFNMDMIAHYENSTMASLFYGDDDTYSKLWQTLADSLVGIQGVLEGASAGSDHYPFTQYGIHATFAAEYIFSTVYHSNQDSTTYMNFEYMTRMVKASAATVYAAMIDATAPALEFSYPDGLPRFITANEPTTITVEVNELNAAVPIAGSAVVHYSLDGAPYETTPMAEISSGLYDATLPAVGCGSTIEYYFSADETTSGTFYDPEPQSPMIPIAATSVSTVFEDNFQTSTGWTSMVSGATSGIWQRGIPVADPTWTYAPMADADGSGACYLTQNGYGNTDVDDGEVILISPEFDFSGNGLIRFDYYLNLSNTDGAVDRLLVEMYDGSLWREITRVTTSGGSQWRVLEITDEDVVAAGLSQSSTMRIRFNANDADPQSVVEAGIDGFNVYQYECTPYICGDADDNGSVNILDATFLISYIYLDGPAPVPSEKADVNSSGSINILDVTYYINYLYKDGPAPNCP